MERVFVALLPLACGKCPAPTFPSDLPLYFLMTSDSPSLCGFLCLSSPSGRAGGGGQPGEVQQPLPPGGRWPALRRSRHISALFHYSHWNTSSIASQCHPEGKRCSAPGSRAETMTKCRKTVQIHISTTVEYLHPQQLFVMAPQGAWVCLLSVLIQVGRPPEGKHSKMGHTATDADSFSLLLALWLQMKKLHQTASHKKSDWRPLPLPLTQFADCCDIFARMKKCPCRIYVWRVPASLMNARWAHPYLARGI